MPSQPGTSLPLPAPDPLDPDFQPYAGLYGSREAEHPSAGPCFICEGRYLVREALRDGRSGALTVLSVLTGPRLAGEWLPLLPPGTRLLVAEDAFLERLLGFQFHRGILCCVQRPPAPEEARILRARRLVVLPRLDNVDNLGQLLRTAAALGLEAVAVGQGPSPYERRTVRVSMGAAWRIPVLVPGDLPGLVARWRDFEPAIPSEVVGAALVEGALPAAQWAPAPRTALVLGPEDRGLDPGWLDRCDRHVVIPMAKDMDSLNVAAAGAILMFRLMS
ncbi:MAG TPA: RNA methyltransferase [Holophaga sp.]|nr:RNA methyltransferase [Holophaga sp.]HPS67547.1 RNA methyltransferase [Holophaga sp.]